MKRRIIKCIFYVFFMVVLATSVTSPSADTSISKVEVENTVLERIDEFQEPILMQSVAEFQETNVMESVDALPEIMVMEVVYEYQETTVEEETQEEVVSERAEQPKEATTLKEVSEATKQYEESNSTWNGDVLNSVIGMVQGPSGKETYYNLDMSVIVSIMRDMGYTAEEYPYYVREDGVKMLGPYVMCAASFDIRPRGTIVETTLGPAIVCDTGEFTMNDMYQLDIAVDW